MQLQYYAQVYGTSEYLDLGGSDARVSWALGEWSVTNASGAVLFAHAGGAEAPACVLQFSAPLANLIWCCTVGSESGFWIRSYYFKFRVL